MSKAPAIVLIVTGGIAAYKALEVVRLLRASGVSVLPVMTDAAERFITPLSLAALAGHEVLQKHNDGAAMPHIALAKQADLVAVLPATADFIAAMAGGRAEQPALALLLATGAPVHVFPAMNSAMWQHPATIANVALLRQRGVSVHEPGSGSLACGDEGPGRLPEPLDAVRVLTADLPRQTSGLRAVVTAGPTRESFDPVRFISNRSSGKQGYAVAQALLEHGFDVTLITGPCALTVPAGVRAVAVTTAQEMADAVAAAGEVDVFVGAAAPVDWAPAFVPEKIKKTAWSDPRWQLTPDILASARARFKVGFAAETGAENLDTQAPLKLRIKGCNLLVANDVEQNVFDAEDSAVVVFDAAGGREVYPRQSKRQTGQLIAQRALAALDINGVRVKLLPHAAGLPAYASAEAAGLDLASAIDCTLAPGERLAVPTGVCLQLPPGTEAQVRPRSGAALKQGLSVLNSPGTIDTDYRGEIKVLLYNAGQEAINIKRGDRIAQLVPAQVLRLKLLAVDELVESARGSGGFGSTGV